MHSAVNSDVKSLLCYKALIVNKCTVFVSLVGTHGTAVGKLSN